MKRVPAASLDSTATWPPCRSTMCLTRNRPSPAPRFRNAPSDTPRPPAGRGAGGGAALKDWGFDAAGIAPEQIGVKATTNEGIDEIGRGLAIAAHAVALIEQI